LRIAYFGQPIGSAGKLLKVGEKFDKLKPNYFSLGSDDNYYDNLNKLGDEIRSQVLMGLNDIALNEDIYERAIKEEVTLQSLLREISFNTVIIQYRRIARGGARLTDYNFRYYMAQHPVRTEPLHIDFNVIAEHNPPTNIQAIIGRNGVGKSHLLNDMIDSILANNNEKKPKSEFVFNSTGVDEDESFSNLICVTFSAFDEFQFHLKPSQSDIKYHYIGLKNIIEIERASKESLGKTSFANEFTSSLGLIIATSKKSRWKSVMKNLDSDPIFRDENCAGLIENYNADDPRPTIDKFDRLSSGHKIILLTLTKLVELVQEKSLVFFDEPETHLHPPLLSSFVRALSELFTDRNAVCIMTTHSPIILQEVPKSCAYKLSRVGAFAKFEPLEFESFGENIGVLTNDVFGLEVTESGFYKILKTLAGSHNNYEDALVSINKELGIEGRAILRSLLIDKEKQL
jgi:predicted ATPase